MPDSLRKRSKLIVYIDSSECTLCRIAHLGEYQIIFNLANQNKGFDVMLLLSNQELGPIPLTRYLADFELPYPVYVDTEKMFILKNQFIPKDNRLHSFFLDESGRPQFVGDPSSSSYMLKAFKQYLYSFL